MAEGDARSGVEEAGRGTRFADVRWHAEIDSTNREALDLARRGEPEGVVVVADHQTAGRGRLGRTWQAPPRSSLLVSILLRPPAGAVADDRLHLLTVAAGVAAVEACADSLGFTPELKWPNDLVVAEPGAGGAPAHKKLGGILAESIVDGGGLRAVVVGLGLNLHWPAELPADIADTATSANRVLAASVAVGPTTTVAGADFETDRNRLLAALLRDYDRWYGQLLSGDPDELVAAYRLACATLGQRVRVDLGDDAFTGTAADLEPDGSLVVDPDDGDDRRVVRAADVAHLRPDG